MKSLKVFFKIKPPREAVKLYHTAHFLVLFCMTFMVVHFGNLHHGELLKSSSQKLNFLLQPAPNFASF
jgi:hypothetical protein